MLKILTCSAKLSRLCYSCCFLFSSGKPITAGECKMQPCWYDCHHRDENQNTGILQNIKRIYLVLISLSWIHSPAFVSICAAKQREFSQCTGYKHLLGISRKLGKKPSNHNEHWSEVQTVPPVECDLLVAFCLLSLVYSKIHNQQEQPTLLGNRRLKHVDVCLLSSTY